MTTAIHYVRRMDSYLTSLPRYLEVASRNQLQDYAIHLTMFRREQTREMEDCLREFGVTSFKIYMMLRGALGRAIVMDQVAEEAPMETADVDFDNGHLYDVFRTASTLPARLRINVHSEDADIVASEIERVRELGWDGLAAWHAARPGHAEAIAIQTVGYLSQQFDVPAYFPHIGSRHGIEALTELRKKGIAFVAETCPQYVALTIESRPATWQRSRHQCVPQRTSRAFGPRSLMRPSRRSVRTISLTRIRKSSSGQSGLLGPPSVVRALSCPSC